MTEEKNKIKDIIANISKKNEWSYEDIKEVIRERNFSKLKKVRNKLVKLYEKQNDSDRKKYKIVIKDIDDAINLIISTRIRANLPINEDMRNFVSYKFGEDSCTKPLINKLFPNINCKDLRWSDIGLDYCSQDKIQIEIFTIKKKINIKIFGIKKGNNNWNLLFIISFKSGFIDYPTLYRVLKTEENYNVQKNISRLNKHFKNFFGIEENPIFYNYISKCYQTRFLYIKNSYQKKAKEIQNSDEIYINSKFEELDENKDS